ncbi:MAG: DNA polymerase/3'-5' exonuclease PolX [Candidatus Magasanikbacteria bacterium]|nr:DNA polymerase/3'-5' exonuclease PolX [Candidatus Magasanikbacteria bacterium]
MINQEIAGIFNKMAFILEGLDVPFKPRAYEKASEFIASLAEDLKDIYKKGGIKALEELPGVGKSMAKQIEEYIKTKKVRDFEDLKKQLPVDIEGLAAIEGLGPKKVRELYQKLKIRTVAALEQAVKQKKIEKLAHFGVKSEANIKRGLEFAKKSAGRALLGYILPLARELEKRLGAVPGVKKIVAAGSIRRWQETVGDIDLLAVSEKPEKIMSAFVNLPEAEAVLARGPTRSAVRLKIGLDADLRVVPPSSFGAALQYFTGDKNHNIKIREIAIKKGYKLNEYGLFKGAKIIACETEGEIYRKLGLQYMEPEIRTDCGEIEAAKSGQLPQLIPFGSLKGDLQTTTDWSDGATSIEEMARAAIRLGLEYIAITDHTKSLAMARGLDEKRLAAQAREIDRLNKKLASEGKKFRILKSAEININKDGTLDIKDETLEKLEVVSVAVHSAFRISKEEMTKRIIRAIEHPLVDILFHPTGRLINRREPYELDMERIIKAAQANKVALEIDAFPDRLDLKDVYARQAAAAGVKLAIDTDAHHPEHLQYAELGVAQARRGWVVKNDVINTWPAEKLLRWCRKN